MAITDIIAMQNGTNVYPIFESGSLCIFDASALPSTFPSGDARFIPLTKTDATQLSITNLTGTSKYDTFVKYAQPSALTTTNISGENYYETSTHLWLEIPSVYTNYKFYGQPFRMRSVPVNGYPRPQATAYSLRGTASASWEWKDQSNVWHLLTTTSKTQGWSIDYFLCHGGGYTGTDNRPCWWISDLDYLRIKRCAECWFDWSQITDLPSAWRLTHTPTSDIEYGLFD